MTSSACSEYVARKSRRTATESRLDRLINDDLECPEQEDAVRDERDPALLSGVKDLERDQEAAWGWARGTVPIPMGARRLR
jgi:hypothetical protein